MLACGPPLHYTVIDFTPLACPGGVRFNSIYFLFLAGDHKQVGDQQWLPSNSPI